MHSKIFQISNKPISKDEYCSPVDFYENSDDFADYIGDEMEDENEKREYIKGLAQCMEGVFTLNSDCSMTYVSEEKLREFKQKWVDYLRSMVNELTADNILSDHRLYRLRKAAERTHVDRCSRFYINEWNGYAGAMDDFVEFIDHQLKPGDRIYVGAIIDFHW